MPLSKKYVVQKSFRLDAQLEHDLEYLSVKLNRPQNELVNLAIEKLMWDNRDWFIENLLVDFCDEYFKFDQEHSHCEIGGVTIDLQVNSDCSTTMYFCFKDNSEQIVDENKETYQDSPGLPNKLKEELRQIAISYLFTHSNDPSIQKALQNRLSYK